MYAYILTQVDVLDPDAYAEYRRLVPASLKAFGGEFIVRGGQQEALEGSERSKRTVILRFPNMDAARSWHGSDAYADAKKVRQAVSEGTVLLVEGIE
jgi:uncharacterized protein (DUF1330 family)